MVWFLQVLLLLSGLFLMLIILLQRGRGGGLAGAFGGMGGQSAFGTKAGDVFTWITVVTATIWVLLAGVGGCVMRQAEDRFARQTFVSGEEEPEAREMIEPEGELQFEGPDPPPADPAIAPLLPGAGGVTPGADPLSPELIPERPEAPQPAPGPDDAPEEGAPPERPETPEDSA